MGFSAQIGEITPFFLALVDIAAHLVDQIAQKPQFLGRERWTGIFQPNTSNTEMFIL